MEVWDAKWHLQGQRHQEDLEKQKGNGFEETMPE